MIYEQATLNNEIKENLFGGNGAIQFKHLFKQGDAFCNKGKLFSHITLKPGISLGTHTHTGEFEIYYITKGEGTYNDNGTSKMVKAGDVTICNDGKKHGIENTGKEDLEIVILILYVEL